MSGRPPHVRRRWIVCVALLALPLSQLGHALAYVGRYGSGGLDLEAGGAHTYFPALLTISAGVVGAGLLATLVFVGLARLAAARSLRLGGERRVSLLDLFLVSATVQLQVYIAQETVEALAAGYVPMGDFLLSLALWSIVGQVPIALIGAIALSWLSVRFRAAAAVWRRGLAVTSHQPPTALVTRGWTAPPRGAAVASSALAVLAKRGPPIGCRESLVVHFHQIHRLRMDSWCAPS